ncbi:hypothetical protein EGJ22_15790 [Pseudomonas sp. p99-361]|nr:hypothetical protein A3K88_11515 [Pseudomonas putida]RRV16697.1 hypothetical protein EGJ22_15790 [Pseudomonas sp. p99-361]
MRVPPAKWPDKEHCMRTTHQLSLRFATHHCRDGLDLPGGPYLDAVQPGLRCLKPWTFMGYREYSNGW